MTNKQQKSFSKPWFAVALLSTAGAVAVHSYLAIRHYRLKFGQVTSDSLCNLSDKMNCDAVAASSYSSFASVPMAVWGASFNLILLLMALCYPFVEAENKGSYRRNVLLLGGVIVGASLTMAGISVVAMSTWCLFCIITYILSFLTFGGLWKALPPGAPLADFKPAEWKAAAIAGAVILGTAAFAHNHSKRTFNVGGQDLDSFVSLRIADWKSTPKATIEPVEPLAMGASAEEAKMTIVEFADFRCSHCKHAAPTLHAFARSRPDVRFVFQAFPLDGDCNATISQSNGASCRLAMAVHCANQQQKGWNAHDWIFQRQEKFSTLAVVQDEMPKMAKEIGADWAQLEACLQTPVARQAIEQQAALGARLNIQGTPTIFVNGRRLPAGQFLPVLQKAYEESLKEN